MKSVLKGFSKKAVALVLALAVIICTLSVSLSVFADDTYNVSYSSPAIPMVVDTKIGFNAVAVQLTDGGSYVSGDQLTWTYNGVSSGVVLDNSKKSIAARAVGTYPFTVTDGVNSKDVFVLVAETAAGPFKIFDYDFSNYDADVAAGKSPWKAQTFRKKNATEWALGEKTASWDSSKGGVALGGGGSSAILYVADDSVIKNFKNYTINFTGAANVVGSWRLIGALARLGLDSTTKLATADSAFVAATVATNSGAGSVLFRTTGYKYKRDAVDFGFAYAANTMYDYSYEFKDNDVIVSAATAGGELTEYYKLSEDTITPEIPTTAGTVGVYVEDVTGYFSKFSVSVDVGDSLPVTLQEEVGGLYEIKNNAPAIATTVLKQIDLNNTVVEFGAEQVLGSDITWETTASGITLDGKTLRTFKKGTFKLTATYESVTKDIYVVVKEENETEWELYSKTFEAGKIPSDWSAQYWNTTDKAWVDITEAPTTVANNPHPGLIPFNYTTPGVNVYQTHGMLTLNNDIVADFSNYTIDLQAVFYGHIDSNGSFIYGRANTTNGKLTTDSNTYGFTIDTRKSSAEPYTKAFYTTYTLNKFTRTKISEGVTDWTSGLAQANQQAQAPMRNWIVKFDGDKATVYDAQDTAPNHVFSYTGIPEAKGTVGIGTFVLYSGGLSGWTKINTFKIKLNNDIEEIPSTEIDAYFIKDAAPVIPMDFLTTADMSQTLIEIDGSFYPGSEIIFTSTSDALAIDNDKDTIFARGIGTFPVTATCGSASRTVYVAVKEMAATEWVLYSKTFTAGELPSDWSAQYWNTTASGKTWIDITEAPTTVANNPQPGLIPFNYTTPGVNVWQTHGMLTLNNDIVADFSDYTIDLQAVFYGHLDSNGSFVYGRTTTTNGKLTTDSNMYGFTVDTRNKTAEPYSKASYTAYTGNAFAHTKISVGVTDWTSGLVKANQQAQAPMRNWIVKFEGSKGTVYDAEDTASNHIFSYSGIPATKGTVGIGTFVLYSGGLSGWTKINTVKIKLNDSIKPVPISGTADDVETVKGDNPILKIKPNTEKALDDFYVEVEGSYYAAKDLTWQAAADSISWANALTVSGTAIKGTKDGLYKAVVTTNGGKQATVYVYVKDTSKVPEDEYVDNGNYKFTIDANGTIKSYSKIYEELPFSQKVIIPAKVDGANAVKVNTNLFNKNETIFSVYFEEGITSVGNAGFSGAKFLKYVYFPNTLEKLEEWAFNGTALKKVVLPDSLTGWTKNTFTYMETIEEVIIGKGVKTFPAAFNKMPATKELKLPYTITKVDSDALKAFTGIEKLYVYNRDAVLDDTQLKAGDTVTIYGATYASDGTSPSTAKALAEANGNKFVAIDDEIKAIEDELKAEIEAENAKIEQIAKTEDTKAVYNFRYDVANNGSNRYYLNNFNPDDATVGIAGKYTIPAVGTAYGITYSTSPSSLTGDKVDNAKITSIQSNAMKSNSEKNRIYNLVISEGYTKIGDSAFYGLTNLRYLTLPSTLTDIVSYAFGDAINLKSLDIPDSVTSIGNGAFQGATSLEEIKLDVDNSSLATIGNSAFSNSAITKIELPVATRKIGKSAFAGSALKEAYIYNTQAEIGEKAFPDGCKIYCVPGSTAEQYAKDNGYEYSATLPDKLEEKLNKVDKNATFKITLENGIYGIGGYTGDGGKVIIPSVADYTDPNGQVTKNVLISKINSNAFKNSASKGKVYAIEISDGIAKIGDSAFNGCSNLMRLTLPNSVVSIEAWAFSYCALEGTVKLGPDCSFVGKAAFGNNPKLEGIYIYNKNAELGEGFIPATTTIYGIKDSTAYDYARKNGNPFVEIDPLPEETINDIKDNGNYKFTSNGAGGLQTYARKDESKDYSAKVVFPAKLNGEKITTVASNIFKARPYTMTIQAAVFEEGIEVIGDSAFAAASRLKYVSLPKSLKEIQDWAFMSCDLRGDIVLSENVTKIGNGSFQNNKNLRSITVNNPTATISPGAFTGVREGFILRGLDNSTLYDFYVKNKKNGFVWESIGVYNKPADEGTTPDDGEGAGETDTDNKDDNKQLGQTQQNAGDSLFSALSTMLGVPEDLTMLIVLALAGGMLLLILIAVVIIVLVAISGDDDDDDDFDDDDFDDDDFDDDDFDDDDFDDEDLDDEDFDEEIGDEE